MAKIITEEEFEAMKDKYRSWLEILPDSLTVRLITTLNAVWTHLRRAQTENQRLKTLLAENGISHQPATIPGAEKS